MDSMPSKVPFSGTKEQEDMLITVLANYKYNPNALMAILQKAQEIYGYLPMEVLTILSEELLLPLEKIHQVVTFYSQFSLSPKGRYQISVCMGSTCRSKGAAVILDTITELLNIHPGECTPDGRFSLDTSHCIGACGLAPVIMVNDEVHSRVTASQIEEILNKYQ